MIAVRRIAASALTLGITIGTLADVGATRTRPRQEDGYWILAGDFHVHAFFGDGALAPWDIWREAARRGIDVVAITNHNQVMTAQLGRWLSRQLGGPLLLAGDEVTAPAYHLIAAGIEHAIDWRPPLPDVIDAVHAQGGVAIAAHPTRPSWRAFSDRALQKIDGAEVAHPAIHADVDAKEALPAFYRRARALGRNLAAIGSTDFHAFAPIGWCRTYVLADEPSERGVVEAIRRGRTVAVDGDGNAYGDDAFTRLVARYREAREAGSRPDRRRWRAFGAFCAWCGLVGIVLFDDCPTDERRRS